MGEELEADCRPGGWAGGSAEPLAWSGRASSTLTALQELPWLEGTAGRDLSVNRTCCLRTQHPRHEACSAHGVDEPRSEQCSGRPGAARLPPCRSAHSHRHSALIPPCPGAQDKRMNQGQSPVGETALPGPRENVRRCDFIAGSRPWKVWGPEWPQVATPCSRTRW